MSDFWKEALNQLMKVPMTVATAALLDVEAVAKRLRKRLEEQAGSRLEIEEIITNIKWAWHYEERYTRDYSLNDALTWFKENTPKGVTAAALYRETRSDGRHLGACRLHHCFVTADNQPILDGSAPVRLVTAETLDSRLEQTFGQHDLIVLR